MKKPTADTGQVDKLATWLGTYQDLFGFVEHVAKISAGGWRIVKEMRWLTWRKN